METRALTPEECERRVVPARKRIFAELDPFGAPFTDGIRERALLFPVSLELEPGQVGALGEAAHAVGDETIFLEVLYSDSEFWEFSVDVEGLYDVVDVFVETAMFSPSGTWGMIISPEDHAVLGGPPEFVRTIAARFPPTELPTQNFLMGSREPEWPEEGSPLGDVVDALTEAGTALPLASGHAFGDGQVTAFLEFWKSMRDWSGTSNDWLAPHLHHLFGEREAERLLAEGGWWA